MVAGDLAFGVLGALEVHRDGVPVPLSSARQRAVLAALLARADRPVTGDALIEAAWGAQLPASPRAALHTLLSRLRAALGPDAIHSEPAGYRLAVGPDGLDATRFEALRGRAARAPTREALGMLDAAEALWRGPAFAEFADREFAVAEAVRLDELRLVAVEDRAALRLELDDADAAAADLERFVREHPLRERAVGLLMTALYRAGRAGDALDRYRVHRTHLAEELGLDPAPALRELQARILDHELPAPAPAAPPRWLASDAPFLGRDDEVAALRAAAAAHRLVTVTGVGGVGKTRLVAEALPGLVERLGLPAAVVELAGTDDGQVEVAVAAALGLGPARGALPEAVLEYLSVTPMLLVLDNCEHVSEAVGAFLGAVLRRCPRVRTVTTSRRRLGLPAEQVLPLEPLAVPAASTAAETAALSASVRLFTDRARRVRPASAPTPGQMAVVGEICRRLDGLPLAIELAATRAATLGVDALRARLDRSLDLLDGGHRPGERPLRAALEWSYSLLDGPERALFDALGVFEGEFDLDAAEAVAHGLPDRPVAASLAALVDASLVAPRPGADGVRYRLLEIVRAFARERLAGSGAEEAVRAAHARWVRTLVHAAARNSLGPEETTAWTGLRRDAASIRAAARWALRAGRPQLAGEITGTVMLASMHRRLHLELVDVVLEVAADPRVRATPEGRLARAAGAFVAVWQGELDVAEREAREVLPEAGHMPERFAALAALSIIALYRGEHDRSWRRCRELLAVDGLPSAWRSLGHGTQALLACYGGDLDAARAHAGTMTALAEAAGADAELSFAAYVAAEVAAAADPAAAIPLLADAARHADRVGNAFSAGLATVAQVAALTRLGRGGAALDLLGPLVERWLRLAVWPQLWTTLRILAELLAASDRPETAALLLAAADQAPSAPRVTGADAERYRGLTATLRARIGAAAHDRIAALAAVLPRAQVVERARAAVDEQRAARRPPGPGGGGALPLRA